MSDRSRDPGADAFDRYFDGERDNRVRADLVGRIRDDARFAEEFAGTQRVVSMLGEKPGAPDLTAGILAEVGARRAFLRPRWRRLVTAGRVAVAASIALGLGLITVAQRYGQEQGVVPTGPTPVSHLAEVSESAMTGMTGSLDSLRSVADSIRSGGARPGARLEMETAARFEPQLSSRDRDSRELASFDRNSQNRDSAGGFTRTGFAEGFVGNAGRSRWLPGPATLAATADSGSAGRSEPRGLVWVSGASGLEEASGRRPSLGWATVDFDRVLLSPVSPGEIPGATRTIWIRSVDLFSEPVDASDGLR